jgi:MFS family permease
MKDRSFAIFTIGSALICIPLSFYYSFANVFLNETGMTGTAGKMALGQVSELLFLLLIPALFARWGVKKMLLIGMAAWALRYVLFAFGNNGSLVALLYAGIILHGICFDFFFVTGFIYTDKRVPREMRGQAQGLLVLVTQGLGMFFGAQIAGGLAGRMLTGKGEELLKQYQNFWLVPCLMAAVVMVVFLVLFKDDGSAAKAEAKPLEAASDAKV